MNNVIYAVAFSVMRLWTNIKEHARNDGFLAGVNYLLFTTKGQGNINSRGLCEYLNIII